MSEAERRIIFPYFLSLTADRYSIDARTNRFLSFLKKSEDQSDGEGYEKKNYTLGKQKKQAFKKCIKKKKYAFLLGVKICEKG